MKKAIALALVLVLALAVFSACQKQEEVKTEAKKEVTLKYTIYNRTGERVTNFSMEDLQGSSKISANNIEDGLNSQFSITAAVDDTGTPRLQIAYVTASVQGANVILNEKADAITLLPGGSIEFKAPAE